MSHRVIAGSAKGRRLKMVPGDSTRPVMDRVKEALFSILGTSVIESSLLDLFAGTGAIGIEALSRGAETVRFIDNNRVAIQTLHENLATTQLADKADVVQTDALAYLGQARPRAFEIIYVAPPQYKDLWKKAMLKLDKNPQHLAPDGLVIVQIAPKEKENLTLTHFTAYDERRYSNTTLIFYELIEPSE